MNSQKGVQVTMRWHLKELIGRYESMKGESIRYEDISQATGLSTNTLTQIARNQATRADLKTINRLLDFFSGALGERLTTDDLLRYYN